MARHRRSSLNGRGMADFSEFIHNNPIVLVLCFDPTTLNEIAVSATKTSSLAV